MTDGESPASLRVPPSSWEPDRRNRDTSQRFCPVTVCRCTALADRPGHRSINTVTLSSCAWIELIGTGQHGGQRDGR